jgi:hypothetical protein
MSEREERLEEALERIARWADAYPLHAFPKPDGEYLRRAHEALTANGLTLDRIAADCMRHVVEGVGRIARDALAAEPAGGAMIGTEAVMKAIAALDKAEKQFTAYAEHHHANGADDKAATNYGYASLCGDALEHLKLYFDAQQ